MAKYFLIVSVLFLLATGCEDGTDGDTTGQLPVAFTARTGDEETTRAGVTDNTNLASMGVFACYTGQNDWSASSNPGFMYNQPVNKTSDAWTYTPVKYWPNRVGDKLSFFAYAPHTDKTGSQLRTYGYNSSDATGYPSFRYEPSIDATNQADLLFASPLMNRTKGSNLSFTMGHVLTHVLFKVKSTSAISVTKVQVNSGAHYGDIKFDTGGYSWTSLSGNQNFYTTATVVVPANTLTDIGEFFLLPSNAASVSLTFSEGGIEQPVTTVALPASPVWEMNKTVAYTLNIENKTKITLSVKAWDSGSVSANLGEEAPTSGYPFAKNGIVYESATKSYYVGPDYYYDYVGDGWGQSSSGWFQWDPAIRICRGYHSTTMYGISEWRLPTINELATAYSLGLIGGSTYWSTTMNTDPSFSNSPWALSGGNRKGDMTKTNGCRLLCIRDMGELTYPTTRTVNDIPVVYLNSSKSYMVYGSNEVRTQSNAISYCSGLSYGGYSGWRLPTYEEATWVLNLGVRPTTTYWTSQSGQAIVGNYRSVSGSGGGWFDDSPAGVAKARTYCVRDY